MLGLYIHVPFCQKRCHYCSFYSTTCGKVERDLFSRALVAELHARLAHRPTLSTLYFGGGTPSQLDPQQLRLIFGEIRSHCQLPASAEVTFEANPDDITPAYAALLADLGVNRISMGVQSFDDRLLSSINRRHTAAQAIDAIGILHEVGIRNISIDLIYGLPGQTLEDWRSDVRQAFSLPITHLSSYALSIEEGTHLYILRARGDIRDTDEDLSLAMYQLLLDEAQKAGFLHYEISNFSRKGKAPHPLDAYVSRHNSSYWTGTPYVGLGPGAHSYDGSAIRRWNHPDLTRYCHELLATGSADYFAEEHLSPRERYDELVMTSLRTYRGLDLTRLTPSQLAYVRRTAQPHLDAGRLVVHDDRLILTRPGLFVSDDIMSDLMWDE